MLATSLESRARALARRQKAERIVAPAFGRNQTQAMVEWQDDPIGWASLHLGIPAHTLRWSLNDYEGHEWDGTPDPIAALLEGVAQGEDVGVEAGTGTGKSFGCAVLTLWFLAVFEDSRVFSYAPKEDQLRQFMWAEIAALWPRFERLFPDAELTDLRIRMQPRSDKWGARGYAVKIRAGEASATGAQGAHAPHMLLIVEEGPGVEAPVYTALENTRTGEHNLQVVVGNPDSQDDPLHSWCLQPTTVHVRASALDFPNVVTGEDVIPGAVSRSAVERRRLLYANSPALFDSRVRGISPKYAHGIALKYRDSDHMETWAPGQLEIAQHQRWRWYMGIDFGAWRFAAVLACVDRAKRVHVVDEHFSGFGTTLAERAEALAEMLELWEVPRERLTIVGDVANQTDIIELNAAWRKQEEPWVCSGVKMSDKARATSVEKLNMLLGQRALLIRRGLGEDLEWRLGASTVNEGEPTTGSRLLWEIKHWRYPDPTLGKAQKQDPDDDSADGADAIAGLRYLVMTWIRAAKFDKPKKKHVPNRDGGLDRLMEQLKKSYDEATDINRRLA